MALLKSLFQALQNCERTHIWLEQITIPTKLTPCHISIQILLKETQTNKKSTKTRVGRSV